MVCFMKINFSNSSSSTPTVICTHMHDKMCMRTRTYMLEVKCQKKSILTNPEGALSDHMPSESIAAANKEVISSSSLTTATAYVSKTFPNSGLHVKLSPICGDQNFLKIWCPRM